MGCVLGYLRIDIFEQKMCIQFEQTDNTAVVLFLLCYFAILDTTLQ